MAMVTIGGPRTLLHPFFTGLAGALLIAALFTDFAYYSTSLIQWSNFSTWLILGGLVTALVAAILLVIDMGIRRAGKISWLDFALLGAAAILSIVNELVHTRDAWTTVYPTGIALSAIVAVLLVIAGFRGWSVIIVRVGYPGERK